MAGKRNPARLVPQTAHGVSMKRIKILEVIDKTFLGGGQINLLSLADSLSEEEFDISICTAGSGPLAEEARRRKIPLHPVDMSRRFRFQTVSQMKVLLHGHDFDIVHTHGGVAGFYARSAAGKRRSFRMVHTQHGIHYLYYRNPVLKNLYIRLERWLSKFTDAVVFVSGGDWEQAMKHTLCPPEKAWVIKNGIPVEKMAAAVERARLPAELTERPKPVIGTVARLHFQKNIPLLLAAAVKLRRHFPGLTVVLAGDGPQRSRLENMSRRMGIGRHVLFLGERRDIPALLAGMDVFVLPSRWEGLPYALLEAGAAKKPVAATDVDGIREVIVPERNGLLAGSGDPEALAESIQRLLTDKNWASKLGKQLYQDVLNRFTLSGMAEQTRNLYLRLLVRRGVH